MTSRSLRYLAPNLLTGANLVFGMLSIASSVDGRFVDAAWWIIYAVLTDRLDGFVARRLDATSELGVQLDSFADALNFGIAPAVLVYTSLGGDPQLPFDAGLGRVFLVGGCAVWVLAAVFRLARYNVAVGSAPGDMFFGAPTTLCGGLVAIWYLTLLKYSPASAALHAGDFGGPRLLGDMETPLVAWKAFPAAMWVGALLMASTLRMRKLTRLPSKALTVFVFSNVAAGYVCGFARLLPEYMVWPPTMWLVVYLVRGMQADARRIAPPPLFPRRDGEE